MIKHGIDNGFNFFNHDIVEAFRFFELIESGGEIMKRIKIDNFVEVLKDELDDISEGVDFGFLVVRDGLL